MNLTEKNFNMCSSMRFLRGVGHQLYLAQPPFSSLSLTHEKRHISYQVFSLGDAHEPPMATIGWPGTDHDVIWIPYKWNKSLIGNDDEGRPFQRHLVYNRRRLYKVQWKMDKKPITEGVWIHPFKFYFNTKIFLSFVLTGRYHGRTHRTAIQCW